MSSAIFCGWYSGDQFRHRRSFAGRRRGGRVVRRLCRRAATVQPILRYDDLRYDPHLDTNSRQGERKILTTRAACLLATAAALGLSHPISAQRAANPSPAPADLIVTNARIYTVDDSRPFVAA